jgi:hypothetical protein
MLPANQTLHGGDRLIFFNVDLFSYVEETHVSLQRKSSLLEAGASCTWFPCEI